MLLDRGRFLNVIVQMAGGSPGSPLLGWPLVSKQGNLENYWGGDTCYGLPCSLEEVAVIMVFSCYESRDKLWHAFELAGPNASQ